MIIDGDKLLRDLRLPYYTIAMLRDMKHGDSYELFDVYGPAMHPGTDADPANAGARIEKVKGGYVLSALWMLHIGKAQKRGHMWSPGVKLKLLPGRKFELIPEKRANGEQVALAGLRLFARPISEHGITDEFIHRTSCFMNDVSRVAEPFSQIAGELFLGK
mgnify:CR=1 FL=1